MYGWMRWRAAETNNALSVSHLDRKSASVGFGLALVAFLVLGWLLGSFTDSDVPWIDAFTSAIAIVGMYWMAEKKLEHWIAWSVVNVVSIPLYLYKDMPLTALQYLVFLLFTFQGWKIWKRVVS
jgi:nicotinamide mononucleotide transporter